MVTLSCFLICNLNPFFPLFVKVWLIYNVVLISTVQHTQLHVYIHIYIYVYILFHILFCYGLSQDIEYSSLCYMGGPYYLSILYIIVF